MTRKALQVICIAQGPHKLAGQAVPTLAAYLPTAFRLRGELVRVRRRSRRCFGAALLGQAVSRRGGVLLIGSAAREAIAARIVGVLLRGSLAIAEGRFLPRRTHGRLCAGAMYSRRGTQFGGMRAVQGREKDVMQRRASFEGVGLAPSRRLFHRQGEGRRCDGCAGCGSATRARARELAGRAGIVRCCWVVAAVSVHRACLAAFEGEHPPSRSA